MARKYRMNHRAEALEQTRARILAATMALHDEKGIAGTSLTDVAARASVSASTVLRHFPTLGDLVAFCGMHVWQEMRPPTPDTAAAVYEGARTTDERLERLVTQLDSFYERGAFRLMKAAQDVDRIPEVAAFLGAVAAGVNALIDEALRDLPDRTKVVGILQVITRVEVWTNLASVAEGEELIRIKLRLMRCAIGAVAAG
jgi:AcrR family transcriptional regulator